MPPTLLPAPQIKTRYLFYTSVLAAKCLKFCWLFTPAEAEIICDKNERPFDIYRILEKIFQKEKNKIVGACLIAQPIRPISIQKCSAFGIFFAIEKLSEIEQTLSFLLLLRF